MSNEAKVSNPGKPARDFEEVFRQAGVLKESLEGAKSAASKAAKIGKFLSANVDRTVPIEAGGRTGTGTVRRTPGRANKNLYHFEVRWDEPSMSDRSPAARHPGSMLDDGLKVVAAKINAKGCPEEINPKEANPSRTKQSAAKRERPGGNDERW